MDKKKQHADGEEAARKDDVECVLGDIDDLNRNIEELEEKAEVAKTDRLKVCGVYPFVLFVVLNISCSTIIWCW